MAKIPFRANVASVRTGSDGGFRVVLDLPEADLKTVQSLLSLHKKNVSGELEESDQ